MGNCFSYENDDKIIKYLYHETLNSLPLFEETCCIQRRGAYIEPRKYRNALLNFMMLRIDITSEKKNFMIYEKLQQIVNNIRPQSKTNGGWLSDNKANYIDKLWIGLELYEFPTKELVLKAIQ